MKKTMQMLIALAAIGALVVTSGCGKHKLNRQTTTSEDDATAQAQWDDAFKVVDETAQEEDLEGANKMGAMAPVMDHTFGTCATVTHDPPLFDSAGVWNATFPKTMTIDFGTGCKGSDGKTRSGKIVATYTGRYRDAGTTITIEPVNYEVDGYKVEGQKVVSNNGRNGAGNLSYSVVVEGQITDPNGNIVTWNSTRTREWVAGEGTGFFTVDSTTGTWMGLDGIFDDAYSITGSADGINRSGRAFTVDITTPLYVQWCTSNIRVEITEGVIEIQPEDLKLRTVDFGDRTCDKSYTVTIGKRVYNKSY